MPASNPFLRHFFDHIVGPNFDTRLGYIVDELCEVFEVSNVQEIVHKHLRIADTTNDAKDPIIHFYEDFLQEYDPLERKRMGAYYTPIPVVKFIVRQVDKILKEEFGIAKGLASDETISHEVDTQPWRKKGERKDRLTKTLTIPRVQVLDPAVGTATFLNETIKFIHEEFKGQEGRWPAYVADNLVKRLHGFELMMAPYTIAHLKLSMTLKETGVEKLNERLGIYLTNTLEEGIPMQPDLFSFGLAEAVSEESQHAAEIKSERPIMIVMGNPPYSAESSNKTKYADSLIDKYRFEPGGKQKLQERNSKMLGDDYVKFISFAEDMIAKNGEGVIGYITNNGYLDNPTFRGMRWHLSRTFDKIYVLNLHGDSRKVENSPDNEKDENIFDIMQGVGIMLAVKTNSKQINEDAEIYHADIYGRRKDKFQKLSEEINWKKILPDSELISFQDVNRDGQAEYIKGIKLNGLFMNSSSGISSSRDDFLVTLSSHEISKRMQDFENTNNISNEDLIAKYSLKETADWTVRDARRNFGMFNNESIVPINYRVFDTRWTYWDKAVNSRMRESTMNHMIKSENLGLIFKRGFDPSNSAPVFASDEIIDRRFWSRPGMRGAESLSPLYLYHEGDTRTPNFNTTELSALFRNMPYLLEDLQDGKKQASAAETVTPESVFDYIYAVLHSPNYRTKYKEFLKIDFPRVPAPKDAIEYWNISKIGRQLRELHLMKSTDIDNYDTTFPIAGSDEVEKLSYLDEKVWINDDQYFGNVPKIAWDFYIGGYQPAQKWQKDRRGRKLSSDDLNHYQRIIKILTETDRIMKEIDNK
ncbi:MAG: Methylase family protein [Candidatus Saccharibacteria bacterium]|nr:Methylase family protein [Candidatus Saccharibacteria bacterium]